jgi:hypothetical protein
MRRTMRAGSLIVIATMAFAGCGTEKPLSVIECGWPEGTALAFEGFGTEAELDMFASSPSGERFYWLVTAQKVELSTSRGTQTVRVACSVGQEGLISWRVVPDDWSVP